MAMIGEFNEVFNYFRTQVKDIYLHPDPFSVQNGLLTPTMKSKRPQLRAYFKPQIEDLYQQLDWPDWAISAYYRSLIPALIVKKKDDREGSKAFSRRRCLSYQSHYYHRKYSLTLDTFIIYHFHRYIRGLQTKAPFRLIKVIDNIKNNKRSYY